MRRGTITAGLGIVGAVAMAAVAVSGVFTTEPVPQALVEASLQAPEPLSLPEVTGFSSRLSALAREEVVPRLRPSPRLQIAPTGSPLPETGPPLVSWSHEIAAGETLDTVLAGAGLAGSDRAEIALALGAEYDLRRLRPGHVVTLVSTLGGSPRRVDLAVDDGVRIELLFDAELAARVVDPDPEIVTLAGEAVIASSIFAAFEKARLPTRFAVDLAQMLGGTVDFRRDLSGGETIRLLWREARVGTEIIGQPELAYAGLGLGDSLYEVIWPDDGSGPATIFVNGEVLRVFAQPVEGARLSSVFGRRTHPVYGNVRMHTGVDFAAARGTPVQATAPGRVSFIGWRKGYGRVIEIAHGADTMTRYSHLSAVADDLDEGQRVLAGYMIGRVGSTGTATGPNLHYEVLVDGRPTDPLADDRLAEATKTGADDTVAMTRLSKARALLAGRLGNKSGETKTERF